MTSSEFSKLYKKSNLSDEVIPWIEHPDSIGISVLRDYPDGIPFKNTINRSGRNDSVTLIKIGYYISEIKDGVVKLFVSISKASKYSLDNNNFFELTNDNPNSPTENSIKISEKSTQPIDLEERDRFEFNTDKKIFIDTKLKKEISLEEMVNFIYNLHIQTLYAKTFRVRLYINKKISELLMFILDKSSWFFEKYFDKKLKDSRYITGFPGFFNKYKINDFDQINKNDLFTDIKDKTEKSSIPGTDLKISKIAFILSSIFLCVVFFLDYYYKYDLFNITKFIKHNKDYYIINIVFIVTIYLIPDIILMILNFVFKPIIEEWRRNGFLFSMFLIIINSIVVCNIHIINKKFKFDPSEKNIYKIIFTILIILLSIVWLI